MFELIHKYQVDPTRDDSDTSISTPKPRWGTKAMDNTSWKEGAKDWKTLQGGSGQVLSLFIKLHCNTSKTCDREKEREMPQPTCRLCKLALLVSSTPCWFLYKACSLAVILPQPLQQVAPPFSPPTTFSATHVTTKTRMIIACREREGEAYISMSMRTRFYDLSITTPCAHYFSH